MKKLENDAPGRVPLTAIIRQFVPTVLTFDNIDRYEEVNSGAGTLNCVNGTIVQPTSMPCDTAKTFNNC